MRPKLMQIAATSSVDPRNAIQKAVGDLSNVSVFSGRVLVGIYIAPEVVKKGVNDLGQKFELVRTSKNIQEDVYQAAVGLVLKKGALAFKDDDRNQFHGQDVQEGDWVTFRPGDAKRIQINGVDCRIVEDVVIDMVVERPEIVTHG